MNRIREDAEQPPDRFISDGPCAGEPLPVSNYTMTCHSNRMRFGLAPPSCVNSASTERERVRFRFTSDGPCRGGQIKVFEHVQNYRNGSSVREPSADSRGRPVQELSIRPCPTDVNGETDRSMGSDRRTASVKNEAIYIRFSVESSAHVVVTVEQTDDLPLLPRCRAAFSVRRIVS
jgi:hypothetical protein